jgi:hypothetical protein
MVRPLLKSILCQDDSYMLPYKVLKRLLIFHDCDERGERLSIMDML